MKWFGEEHPTALGLVTVILGTVAFVVIVMPWMCILAAKYWRWCFEVQKHL